MYNLFRPLPWGGRWLRPQSFLFRPDACLDGLGGRRTERAGGLGAGGWGLQDAARVLAGVYCRASHRRPGGQAHRTGWGAGAGAYRMLQGCRQEFPRSCGCAPVLGPWAVGPQPNSRGLRPLPPTPKTNSQHSELFATANGMRAIHCVVNGLLLKFGLKRSASCVCSS